MMEDLVLPKLSIGEAYYSRQLYFYVLGVVIHKGDKSQSVNDIYFFTWMECENRKDSNMICSAIEHLLKNVLKDKCFNASSLRLFSDACYGQNKNINMELNNCSKLAKKDDVFRLLGLVGAEGRILSMYKTLLCNATEDNASLSEEDSS